MQQKCPHLLTSVSALPCEVQYIIMLMTTAHQQRLMSFAVSHKCIPE